MRIWVDTPSAIAHLGELPADVVIDEWDGSGELPDSMQDVEFYVVGFGFRPEILDAIGKIKNLRVVQVCVAGYDRWYDSVPAGVQLCNAKGVQTPSTAEWVVAATLTVIREFPQAALRQASGIGANRAEKHYTDALYGKTVLILGYGSIGSAVEARFAGFGVEMIRVASRARDGVYGPESLRDLLPRADVVTVVAPSTPETFHLVDAEFLSLMHDGALLVNVSRGALVDQDALLSEMQAGRLLCALDVGTPDPLPGDHPLLQCPGVFYTPHQAGPTRLAIPSGYAYAGSQLRRYARGEPLENVVKS